MPDRARNVPALPGHIRLDGDECPPNVPGMHAYMACRARWARSSIAAQLQGPNAVRPARSTCPPRGRAMTGAEVEAVLASAARRGCTCPHPLPIVRSPIGGALHLLEVLHHAGCPALGEGRR